MTSEYYFFLLQLPDSLHLLRLLRFTGVEYCSGQSKSLSVWELFLALRRQGCKIEYRYLWQVSFVEKIPPFRTDNTIAVQSLLNIGNVWRVLFFSSVPVKVEFKSSMAGFWIMSVFIRILAFTERLSDLIQSDRFLIELLAYGQKGLLPVMFWWERGTKWTLGLCDACPSPILTCALDPFWAPSKAAPISHTCLADWNLAINSVLHLRSPIRLTGSMGVTVLSLTGELRNGDMENCSVH